MKSFSRKSFSIFSFELVSKTKDMGVGAARKGPKRFKIKKLRIRRK